jgi:hypothetical protein
MKVKLLLLPLTLFLTSCSGSVAENELFGRYEANYGNESATLLIMPDHTYQHIVRKNNRQIADEKSVWRVTQLRSSGLKTTAIDFSDFVAIPSFAEKKDAKKGWVPEVDRTWLRTIRLCFDSDVGYCYVKRSD